MKAAKTKTVHKSKGVTTGLGVCSWFWCLFRAQEIGHRLSRRTDEEIAQLAASEFPGRDFGFLHTPKRFTVDEYRHRYNSGKFTPRNHMFPWEHIYSFRHDNKGNRVDNRTGKKLLTSRQIAAKLLEWELKHGTSRQLEELRENCS